MWITNLKNFNLMDLFQQAVEHLRASEINNFATKLIEFHNQLTCNCYWRIQKVNLFEELLSIVEKEKENDNDFNLHLTKGFLLAKYKKQQEAFNHLSRAIELNPRNDLAYALRSSIDPKFNSKKLGDIKIISPSIEDRRLARIEALRLARELGLNRIARLEDAYTALKLNPTARNNFIYAASCRESNEDEIKEAIFYYKKAIELNPNFVCAHYSMAKKFGKLKNIDNEIQELELCIELEPNHWGAYYSLWVTLNNKDAFEEAYKIAETGYRLFPNDSDYIYAFGKANYSLKKYEQAINLFDDYLKLKPDDINIKRLLEGALDAQPKKQILKDALKMLDEENLGAIELFEKYLIEFELFNSNHTSLAIRKLHNAQILLLKKAMGMYFKGDYSEAIKNFELYLEIKPFTRKLKNRTIVYQNVSLNQEKIDAYFFCLLKTNDIETDEENPNYKNLLGLTLSYFRKVQPKELWYFNTANNFATCIDFKDFSQDLDEDDLDENDIDENDIDESNVKKENDIYEIKEESEIELEDLILTEDEENANKLKAYDSFSTLNFGKYEGQKLHNIFNLEPTYILWCIINLIHFSIDKSFLLDKKFRMQDDFLLALESNYIKGLVLNKRRKYIQYKEWLARIEKSRNRDCYNSDYYQSNNYQKDNFDALTDGQYGDYEDWQENGGNMDSLYDDLGY